MLRNILILSLSFLILGALALAAFGPSNEAEGDSENVDRTGEFEGGDEGIGSGGDGFERVGEDGEPEDRQTDPNQDELSDDSDVNGDAERRDSGDGSELSDIDSLVLCMKDAGVVIFGSVTCPYCVQLVEAFGGYDVIAPIYVECSQEGLRCQSEMIGRGVPEIQISGEMYRGSRNPQDIGRAVGCEIGS